MTADGKMCDKWKQYEGYEVIVHDYCRNFNDKEPWCFSGGEKVCTIFCYINLMLCDVVN